MLYKRGASRKIGGRRLGVRSQTRVGGNRNKRGGARYKINKRNEYGRLQPWGEMVPFGGTRRVGGTRRRTGGRRRGRPCKRRRCPPCHMR